MEFFNGILAVTFSELTRCDDGEAIISRSNYDALCRRNNLTVLRPGKGLDHPALVEWSSMPTRFKEKFIAKYGDPEKIMSKDYEPLTFDTEAAIYFDRRNVGGVILSDSMRDRYVLNASVLNRLIDNANRQKARRGGRGNHTPVNWDNVVRESEMLRDAYGHTLPQNVARLRDKIREYQREGYGCLISGKIGNSNSGKLAVGTPAGEWVTAMMRSRYPKMSVQDVQDEYNRIAESKGWKSVRSEDTFRKFVNLPEVRCRWSDTIQGELALRQSITAQHSTQLPSCRDMLWYGDGTKLNLYYKAYVDGKYKAATLTIYEVIDACSEVFLGCAIGTEENFELMYAAYRHALEFAGHKPYEIVFDGQGGTRRDDAQWFFHNIAVVSRYAMPFHGNSKTIESIFGRFQSTVLRKRDNYTGGNITARSERSRADLEYINANIDNLPTYEELIDEIMSCREEWNSMAHPDQRRFAGMSRMQVYESTVNAKAPALTEDMKRDMWMIPLRNEVAYTQRGMCFTCKGVEYEYTVQMDGSRQADPYWTRDNMGRRFEVHVDPWALGDEETPIRLYTVGQDASTKKKSRTFVTEARVKPTIHRAIGEQEEWEAEFIRETERNAKQMRVEMQVEATALEMKYGIAPEQNGKNSPKLQGLDGKEYERYADRAFRKPSNSVPEPSEVYPDSVGKTTKKQSYADRM